MSPEMEVKAGVGTFFYGSKCIGKLDCKYDCDLQGTKQNFIVWESNNLLFCKENTICTRDRLGSISLYGESMVTTTTTRVSS